MGALSRLHEFACFFLIEIGGRYGGRQAIEVIKFELVFDRMLFIFEIGAILEFSISEC